MAKTLSFKCIYAWSFRQRWSNSNFGFMHVWNIMLVKSGQTNFASK